MVLTDKELGLEVAGKDEAAWIHIKEGLTKQNEDMLRTLEINKEILKLCEKKLKELQK